MSEIINDTQKLEQLVEAKKNFFSEIGKIVIGQKVILDQMLIALLTRGHTLLVGVPGLAKTKKGSSIVYVCPPAVTLCSCIASNSAACVFGGVLFISSARTIFPKIGPL